MNPERWQQVRDLLHSAMKLEADERGAFLDQQCPADTLLRQEVNSLLAAERELRTSFLESPPIAQVDGREAPRMTSLASGTKLGHYEIAALIGSGGMGEVYRARDPKLGRDVAVKVLLNFSADPNRLRRFEQEARATAVLNHPNILAVFEMGTHEGAPYLVSELLEGETLRAHIRRGRLPGRKAVDYGVQIAHGLAAAHEKGIAHRDLKPENLWITRDGRVKILDFGLAKLTQPEAWPDGVAPTQVEGTKPGEVMGTVGYMSPEQVRGQRCDHRADIFSFGAILYEMLAGSRAFQKSTSAETMTAILNDDPPVAHLAANGVPGLQRVVSRCLEKNPEQRFQSASDLAFAIEALTDASSTNKTNAGAAALRQHARRWGRWAIPVLLIGVVLGVGRYRRHPAPTTESPLAQIPLDIRALTETGEARAAAATPDGRYIAYVNRDAGKYELRLLQVATKRDVVIQPGTPLVIVNLHFSPDGNFIFFLRQLETKNSQDLGVFRVATLGGPATPIAKDARQFSLTVSPDGKQIAYIAETATESQIIAVDADGTNRHVLAKRPLPREFWFLEWSPLPDRLAAVALGDDDLGVVTVSAGGVIRDLSVRGWGAVGQPVWSPDATTIFVPAAIDADSGIQIWAIDSSTGAGRPITTGTMPYAQWGLSITGAGDLIATTQVLDTTIWVTDHSGRPNRLGTSRGEGWAGVAWVDDKIATSNIAEIMLHDARDQSSTRLHSYSRIYRQITRCGPSQVAFWASDSKHGRHIGRIDINSGAATPITDGTDDSDPTCNADGSTLVFAHCPQNQGKCSIVRKSMASGSSVPLYSVDEENWLISIAPTIAPDGTQVLFRRPPDPGNPYEWAAIMPVVGGEPRGLSVQAPAGEVAAIRWAPDGQSIFYARNENGVGNIWSLSLHGGGSHKLTSFKSDSIFSFDVSPDNRLLLSRGSLVRDVVLIKNVR